MILEHSGDARCSVPIEDMGNLIIANNQVTITSSLMSKLQENGCSVIFCGDDHLPIGVTLPLHKPVSNISKNIQIQIANRNKNGNMWDAIITEKINNQSALLSHHGKNYKYLDRINKATQYTTLSKEALSAKHYWSELFENFTRHDNSNTNIFLNYGYSIIRSMVARALIGAGINITLGVFHSNKDNSMCLVDDVMEPFRPIIDNIVFSMITDNTDSLTVDNKRKLIESTNTTVLWNGRDYPLYICMQYFSTDLIRVFSTDKKLKYPGIASWCLGG